MQYAEADKGSFNSGVSDYAVASKSSSHIKPNEKSAGGGTKATNRPYKGVGGYTSKMGWGKKQANA